MCLILLAWHAHPAYPLVFAGNRDEAYDRPSSTADFWDDAPDIHGGRDLEKGGTWLGLARDGRFAAVTNYRDGLARKPAPRSRGELTANYLRHGSDPGDYLKTVAPDAMQYAGFSLLVGDPRHLHVYSNRGAGAAPLSPGVHGLSNHLLDTPWPKVTRGMQRVSALVGASEKELVAGLFDALADRSVVADVELPDTGVGPARERELSPAFIAGERYGTRASTVLLLSREGKAVFIERRFGPLGAPLGETKRRFALQVGMRASGRVTKAAGQDV
jgi:uncharacterized protein with NRDE domain